jgi:light-regulated signal transduction histidine kinase (bacteriophytochrome)
VGFELLGRTVTLRPTLPVARRIVEAHAGVLDVESAPAAGSTFRVRLPPV